jgi:hypothetical protein
VLTSKTSSLGEIAGDAAETIDPTDTDAMSMRFSGSRPMASCAASDRDRGLQRARSFSWTQTAREMLAVYHRAAGVTRAAAAPVAVERGDRRWRSKSMSRSKLS